MEMNNIDEEDEDVVIQGSALHEHLSKLGYTDFESVPMPKRTYFEEKHFVHIDIKDIIKNIYVKLSSFYSWITQEKNISKKQLTAILNAEALLDDHSSMINNSLTKCNSHHEKITLQKFIITGAILISSTCISICKHKILPILFTSSAICSISYIKYLRYCADRDLKNVISLQNDIFIMCKKSLKILRRNYKIKVASEIYTRFSFLGEELQYLQSLIKTLQKFMENISYIYYQCSLSIIKLLPSDVFNEELFTKFEHNSFWVSDEIDYQKLKKLYHTYLLVQSEMLYLLAIAYDSNIWICSCQNVPEIRLAYIIYILYQELALYKVKLSDILNAYDSCKKEPIQYKTRDIAKWHDPTIQLDLASYKLQLAYYQVFSIFNDIDNCIAQETGIDKETAEVLMQKLDKAFKEIGTAKNLAEFVVLLMAKSGFDNLRNNQPVTDSATINQTPEFPVIINSDPEIFDEVFEEYINEEYLKPLHEEVDEHTLEQRKLDKLLLKNFMSELKEALIDKHKSMSERESKALQRTHKNILKDSSMDIESNIDCQFIPIPPPMPSNFMWATSVGKMESDLSNQKIFSDNKIKSESSPTQEKIDELNEENNTTKELRYENTFNISSIESYENKNEESLTSLQQILLKNQITPFVTKLPLPFLEEETFVGSGENSEDEIMENINDNENNGSSH